MCLSTKFRTKSIEINEFHRIINHIRVKIVFPKRRVKRSVLFSLSDLIVSFGGAAALFLGCSFLSGVEFIFFFLEYIGTACWWRMQTVQKKIWNKVSDFK
ncbi:hypothetical protein pipiens_018234 [Culex pipiens pipiens]|uniref:Uncharacterized protein n=1 Tax=Culex pipiens pipiens TaxID=38569 RepID=A0ABD1CCU3_CULPP